MIGGIGMLRYRSSAFLVSALMMVLFFHAARMAMVTFDPFLSSRPLARKLLESPPGGLVIDHHYYTYSSVFFYTGRSALLLNGKFNNLVYGAAAPGAPPVFIDDEQWRKLWSQPDRWYLVAGAEALARLKNVVGADHLSVVMESGGKFLLTNHAGVGVP